MSSMGWLWIRPYPLKQMQILNIHSHYTQPEKDNTIYSFHYTEYSDLYNNLYCSIGIHPWYLNKPINWKLFKELIQLPNVVAIGESGIDSIAKTDIDIQTDIFRKQAELSEWIKKPLIIHMVKSTDQIIKIRKEIKPKQPWVIHGFRGKPELAALYLNHGFIISIGARYNSNTVKTIPLDKLCFETDEENISIKEVISKVAKTIDIDENLLIKNTLNNCNRILNR